MAKPPKPLRLKSVEVQSYGAFGAPERFDLNGKNLIVYGENGAGKSSLFRALRDLFARKPLERALHRGRHRPEDADRPPIVTLTFNDKKDPIVWTTAKHPGRTPADPRLAVARLASSFLDYQTLLGTNALHGRAKPNFFRLIVEDLLFDYRPATSTTSLEEDWTALKVPEKHSFSGAHKPPLEAACATFNAALENATEALVPVVNDLLTALGHPELQLERWDRHSVRYNNEWERKKRAFVGNDLFPRFRFRDEHKLDRPQTFLNEARLSALGIALYLAGRLACIPADAPGLKLLVLDDVLVGLDYSNRRPLLGLLRTRFAGWQIILLTHDRYWFEIVRASIPLSNWRCYEMFEAVTVDGVPTPLVRSLDANRVAATLAQAEQFILAKHIPAAANYARSGCELLLREHCELKKVAFPYKPDPRKISFEDLKSGLRKKVDAAKQAALDAIGPHQSRVLNPLSHDPTIALNEAEVVAAIAAVNALKTALEA